LSRQASSGVVITSKPTHSRFSDGTWCSSYWPTIVFYLAINSREPFHQTLIRSPNFNPCTLLPSEKAVRLVSISWAHSSVTHSLLIMYDNVFGRKVLERQPNNWHYSVILWDIHQSSRTVRDPINRRVHLIGNHSMWPLIDHLLMTMLDTW